MQISKMITCRPMIIRQIDEMTSPPLPPLIKKPQAIGQKWRDFQALSQGQDCQMCQLHVQCHDKAKNKAQRQTMSYICCDQIRQMQVCQSNANEQTQIHFTTKRQAHSQVIQVCHHLHSTFLLPTIYSPHDQSTSDETVQAK